MSIMERVTDLEGKNGISISQVSLVSNLGGSHSVLIHFVVPLDALGESHVSRDEEISLVHNVLSHGVSGVHASESSSADLFLSVIKENRVIDDSVDLIAVGNFDALCSSERFFLLFGDVLCDRHGEEVSNSVNSEGLLVHDLEQFHLVHESFERVSPTISDGLEELKLHCVDIKSGHVFHSSVLSLSRFLDESGDNARGLGAVGDDTGVDHVSLHSDHALVERFGASVDDEVSVFRCVVGSGNTGEVGESTSASFSVHSLDITCFTSFERRADVALNES